jgi:hypothetical protein
MSAALLPLPGKSIARFDDGLEAFPNIWLRILADGTFLPGAKALERSQKPAKAQKQWLRGPTLLGLARWFP